MAQILATSTSAGIEVGESYLIDTRTGANVSDTTATASDVASGKYFYSSTGVRTEGTYTPTPTQTKTLTLGANTPSTTYPDNGYNLSEVRVSFDSSVIKADNIAKDVQVLGITGTHEGGIVPTGNKELASSTADQEDIDVTEYATVSISKIASGALGTVEAVKGTVTDNSITITPQIVNGTIGYINVTSKSGTPVTVSAEELVSGNKSLESSTEDQINIDVKNYSTVSIAAIDEGEMGVVSATKEIDNHTATITPIISAGIAGYNEHAATSGAAVTVTANELVSGTASITTSLEATDVTNYASAEISDEFLVTGNIKSGVSILGVAGSAETIETVTSVPTTKSTNIIYNSTDSSYYIWED